MKIAYASDLHLEFGLAPLEVGMSDEQLEAFVAPVADILILAGDTCEVRHAKHYHKFWKACSEYFNTVVVLLGNHEYYGGTLVKSRDELRKELNIYTNVIVADDQVAQFGDVVVAATTMWTDYNGGCPLTQFDAEANMNDYRMIRRLPNYQRIRAKDILAIHNKSKNWLQETLVAHCDKKVVVATHHAPTFSSVHPKYAGQTYLNGAYASKLDDLILDNENIVAWIHGHTHHKFDYMVGQANVLCHPRGYPGERPNRLGLYQPAILEV